MILPEMLCSCARPVVFETGVEDAPHAVFGSSFLVGYRRRVFVITARHVLQPEAQTHALCVRSPTGRLLTLTDVFFAPASSVPDDWADLAAVEVDLTRVCGDMGETRIFPITDQPDDWMAMRHVSPFILVGFPNEHTYVDFETGEIVEGLVEMQGNYVRPAESPFLHEIAIQNPPPLESYSGFSGCPVFTLKYSIGAAAIPVLCGVAVQGSVASGIVRFIEMSVLVDLLTEKLKKTGGAKSSK
jgi:hypothetical protein